MSRTSTLATRLGTTVHRSLLLHRLASLGLGDANAIAAAASSRGLDYYSAGEESQSFSTAELSKVSHEELVVALVHSSLPWEPQRFRLAAALMASPGVSANRLANLAIQERVVAVIAEIARSGRHAEPENAFWAELLSMLPEHAPVPAGVMPHPSRYMVIPGRTGPRATGPARWVRPRKPSFS